MSKHASWLVFAVVCSTLGCKALTHQQAPEAAATAYAYEGCTPPQSPTSEFRSGEPARAATEIRAPESPSPSATSYRLEQQSDLNGVTGMLAHPRVDGGAPDTVSNVAREFTQAVTEMQNSAKGVASALRSAAIQAPVEPGRNEVAARDRSQAPNSVAPPSLRSLPDVVWYWGAPLSSALFAYVLAPLLVDHLKGRLDRRRRPIC